MRNKFINYLLKIGLVLLVYLIYFNLFYLFNQNVFSGLTFANYLFLMLASLRFSLSAIAYTNLLYAFLVFFPCGLNFRIKSTLLNSLFFLVNSVAFVFCTIDLVFFKFNGKRTGIELFLTQGMGSDLLRLIPSFALDYWYVIIVFIILIYTFVKCVKKINVSYPIKPIQQFWISSLVWIFVLALHLIGGRGGLQLRSIKPVSAGLYAEPQYIPLVLNTPFCILRSSESSILKPKQYFRLEADRLKEFNPIKQFSSDPISSKPNVIIIILESFSNEYIGYFNKGKSYTPFLDSIFRQSHLYVRAYANGKRSIEGIPAVIAGMPSLSETPYISSNYSSNKIDALGSILKRKGYITSFFHGGHNGTMGFEYFTKIAGYDNYYGLNEFSGNQDDFDGKWGVFDKPFLLFSAKEISNYKKPFLAGFFTLSSHHPFLLPRNYIYKGPKKIKHPILKTIQYTDEALKAFFEYAKTQPWFKNTLFVFTADHTGPDLSKKAGTMAGIFQIPIAYYMPGKIEPKVDYRVTQQIDIAPTILDYLGYKDKFYAFGNSMRDRMESGFAFNYCLNTYQLFSDTLLYHYFNEESLRLLKPYSDTMLVQNWNKDYFNITRQMEIKTKAIIQTYNNDLIKNRTYANH